MSNGVQTIASVAMNSKDEIALKAEVFRDVAAGLGLRVLPWHNLGSSAPMIAADGEFICSSVFGWDGENEWWHGLARRRMCPLADLCRYQAEPFWANIGSELQSRHSSPFLSKVDLEWLWKNTPFRSILVVPLHMQFGQVGLVGFVSEREDIRFEESVDILAYLSHSFVSSYIRVMTAGRKVERCEPLTAKEIDCLSWAFVGKTDRDIAEIIQRSYATVRFYISSAGTKLNTLNRAQTLAKAATLGYFAAKA